MEIYQDFKIVCKLCKKIIRLLKMRFEGEFQIMLLGEKYNGARKTIVVIHTVLLSSA